MKKFALVSIFMILTTHLPMLSPSKFVPAEWLDSLEYGKKSMRLVLRLYQIQKNHAGTSQQKAADDASSQATVCPFQPKASPV